MRVSISALGHWLAMRSRVYAVREAKKDAFNPLADFASMCLEFGPEKTEAAGNLYRAYEHFAEVNEGQRLDKTPFGRRLNGMGIVKDEQLSKRLVYRRGACLNDIGKAYLNGPPSLAALEAQDRKDRLRIA